ncbi:MAG TPA: VOC family protein [Candidatus Kapabacteria bacterium]|nr:VOC family protein [Candidatus Kapabacteria bacterium]
MQKIIPHLWYDKEAKEAAEFYVSAFSALGLPDTHIQNINTIHNTPSGDCDTVSFELGGQHFMAISAGPYFTFNPSVSFMLNFDPSKDPKATEHLDQLWEQLSQGGKVLMELQEYPFSKRYGWLEDKYGLSWQLILTNPTGEPRPFIVPSLLFVTDTCDKAEEATDFYISVFKNAPSASGGQAARGVLARYPAGMEPNKEGAVMFTDFQLFGQWFAAMDGSSRMHHFKFNEAVSFMVKCDTQEEIDYYWGKLSAVPESEQCGWLKDKYGFSWQIVPTAMDEMMNTKDQVRLDRVTQAFLKMKKFDITELQKAAEGK